MRMFGNISPQAAATSGFARRRGSANNKTEATSKIIKVSFLRTSMVPEFQQGDLDTAIKNVNVKDIGLGFKV